ncbi:alpha/beta hydrolase [Kineosporia sp. J2-2]|uniref:Alpha/beta hydrolase n=1 Tax=Kineosporia corallincola TaxID=2835133 RepID=A0ABS5TEQ5_9ACTN|nr:alpha/beta hydrolase [Kineosporia corallincola]MBT0769546.1 alpha/beta hydrolase [Kineosporia corallincola]
MMTTSPQTSQAVPPFDAECAAALAPIADMLAKPVTIKAIPMLRTSRDEMTAVTAEELSRGGRFDVQEVEVAAGVPLLICRPAGVQTPVGAIYWIHGGGMIMGDHRTGLGEPFACAEEFGLAVVSVGYRLAPEHPHPTPVEDCYAALVWLAGQAAGLGIDPARIVCAGGSAGGGLAAAVALLCRDRGGPALLGQMLLCPMLDDRNDSFSARQMSTSGTWRQDSNETGWTALLGDARGGPEVSPYAAPARATDLSGLPPAFVDVGSAEIFRDEDVAYAMAIWQAGGVAELHVWPGGYHGYPVLAPHAQLTRDTTTARLGWLRRLLEP